MTKKVSNWLLWPKQMSWKRHELRTLCLSSSDHLSWGLVFSLINGSEKVFPGDKGNSMLCINSRFISINKRGFEGNNYGWLICNLDICKIVDSLCFLFKWRTFSTFIANPGFNRPIQIHCTRTQTERENKLFHSLHTSQTYVFTTSTAF